MRCAGLSWSARLTRDVRARSHAVPSSHHSPYAYASLLVRPCNSQPRSSHAAYRLSWGRDTFAGSAITELRCSLRGMLHPPAAKTKELLCEPSQALLKSLDKLLKSSIVNS